MLLQLVEKPMISHLQDYLSRLFTPIENFPITALVKQGWVNQSIVPGEGGGHSKTFDRDAPVIFWGLKFHKLLSFWVAQTEGYFLGLKK